MKISIEWRHKIKATSKSLPGEGFRSFAAWILRHIADRVDGGQSIRVEYSTTPLINQRLASECIERGMSHANRLLGDMAHHQACEDALRDKSPELFEHAEGDV